MSWISPGSAAVDEILSLISNVRGRTTASAASEKGDSRGSGPFNSLDSNGEPSVSWSKLVGSGKRHGERSPGIVDDLAGCKVGREISATEDHHRHIGHTIGNGALAEHPHLLAVEVDEPGLHR